MLGHLHCIQGFREGSDLIYLDEDGIGDFKLNTAAQTFDIGDKQIISHKLDLFSQMFRQVFPAFPVILPEPILNGNNGKFSHQFLVVLCHLPGIPVDLFPFHAALPWEKVHAFFLIIKFTGGCIDGNGDLFTRFVSCFFHCMDDQGQHFL